MGEAVKVVVRSRPMNRREITLGCKNVIFMDSDLSTCQIVNPADSTAPPKVFTFDGVYDEHSSTEDIYNEIAYPLIEGALEGYNSTIFAYGQTGCGKSFTMQGIPEPSAQRGIIPRSFEHIFEAISVAEGTKYLVLASYLEIYNEEIRDLLGNDIKRKLELKEHADKGVYVQDLSLHPVQCISDCEKLMKKGWQNRATASTLMNTDSSRSHSIFSMHLEMMPYNGFECDLQVSCNAIKKGKLNLVDLAGSERQAKTGATGDRLKEASKINLSLSALGNVISALVDGRSKHIPYRDSKLTRLLQDSLGGNTKTLMVACLSPADNNYDETLSTLRFANRAKNIKNKPRINQDPKDTMISEYQEEIKKLKQLLESSTVVQGYQNVTDNILQEEKEKVRSEYEIQMEELRRKCEDERTHKYQLQVEMENLRKHYEDQIGRINAQVTVSNCTPSSSSITTANVNNEAVLGGNELTLSAAHQEVLMRLQKLKKSMVGGERAHDKELKEKRQWKKKVSERRLQALANVLAKVDDEEGLMLKVYDDIQQELDAKTELLKRNKIKIRGLENEISDIQSEFEKERTDYLETIRKLSCELKLYQQISEKIVPTLRKECNYSDIEHIKNESIWNEDTQHWKLPDLIVTRTKLPPTGFQPNGLTFRSSSAAQTSPKSSRSSGSCHSSPPQTVLSSPDIPEDDVKTLQQKQGASDECGDIAVNYFKPKRATELLNRAKVESSRAFNTWRDYKNRKKGSSSNEINNLSNSMVNTNGIHSSTGDLPLYAALKGSNVLNSSWGGDIGWLGSGLDLSTELSIRRPTRLEALPIVHKKNSTS